MIRLLLGLILFLTFSCSHIEENRREVASIDQIGCVKRVNRYLNRTRLSYEYKLAHLKVFAQNSMNHRRKEIKRPRRRKLVENISWPLKVSLIDTPRPGAFHHPKQELATRRIEWAIEQLTRVRDDFSPYFLKPEITLQINRYKRLLSFYRGEESNRALADFGDDELEIGFPDYISEKWGKVKTVRSEGDQYHSHTVVAQSLMKEEDRLDTHKVFGQFLSSIDVGTPLFSNYFEHPAMKSLTIIEGNEVRDAFHLIFPSEVSVNEYRLVKEIRKFLYDQYSYRLNIEKKSLDELMEISQELDERTVVLASSKHSVWPSKSIEGLEITRNYGVTETDGSSIKGTISMVISDSESEKLPLEIFTGFQVPREKGRRYAEIGRLASLTSELDSGLNADHLIAAMATIASRVEGLKGVYVEADIVRSRFFKRFGFKSIHQQINYEGKKEFVMYVETETLRKRIEERIIEEF